MTNPSYFDSNNDENDSDSPPPPHSKSIIITSPTKNEQNTNDKPSLKTQILNLKNKNTMQRSVPIRSTSKRPLPHPHSLPSPNHNLHSNFHKNLSSRHSPLPQLTSLTIFFAHQLHPYLYPFP